MPPQPRFPSRAAEAGQVHLRILATTDLHAHVLPYDYFTDQPSASGGLARAAPLIRSLRDEAPNTLLLDNGDLIQGTPLGDYVALERGVSPEQPHPTVTALNHLGYDAGTVGNHEFNYGLEIARVTMAAANHPVVLSNVTYRGRDGQPFAPYALLQKDVRDGAGVVQPLKIGILGFTPPQILNWDRPLLEGVVEAHDIVSTARRLVPELKALGADLVVALCHSGIGPDAWQDRQENAAVPLAAVPGIDAVVTGHTHKVFPGPDHEATPAVDPVRGTLNGVPAVKAGFWGSHVGVIDLLLERQGGDWVRTDFECAAQPTQAHGPEYDAELTAALEADHQQTLAYVRRPIGETRAPLQGYFALVSEAPTLRLVQDAQAAFLRAALVGTRFEALPVLSAAAPFKAGGPAGPKAYSDIPPGALALKHAADLYPYPNSFAALRVTGDVLREWLERAAGRFAQISPGAQDAPLLDAVFPSYDFDVISGVEYEFDLRAPPRYALSGALQNPEARRVATLTYQGRPVEDAQEFLVATHSYRVGGGGNFTCLSSAEVVLEETKSTLDILIEYIATPRPQPPTAGGSHWGFQALPGTTALFDTGPGALAHLSSVSHLRLQDLGLQPSGFQRFRLEL